jgi:hypothetical protein
MEPLPIFSARRFAGAALDPAAATPPGIARDDPGGRFAVYRNNVLGGLVRALEARFPVLRRLVGEAFFAGMAAAFATRNPPRSPLMFDYGSGFDAFIAAFPPAAGLPYLADVAALEIARGRAFHAADAAPVPPDAFAGLVAQPLDGLRLVLHPSLAVLRSAHPVVSIWAAHQGPGEPAPIAAWQAEDALVHRAGDTVAILALPPGEAVFLDAVRALAPLGAAAATALAEAPGFDVGRALARLIGGGLVVALQQDTETAE